MNTSDAKYLIDVLDTLVAQRKMRLYRLYMKTPIMTRWEPVDWYTGLCVPEQFATVFEESEMPGSLQYAKQSNDPSILFEMRKVPHWKIIN